jgi:hypothetical protein
VVHDYGRWISMLALGCALCISTQDSGPVATRWRAWATLPLMLLWILPYWVPLGATHPLYYFAPFSLRLLALMVGWT